MIEATVALALLALLVGVVAPNMARWYAGVALRVSMGEVHQAVAALQSRAVFGAQDLSLKEALRPKGEAGSRLPRGWALEPDASPTASATYWRNGACTPGLAFVSNGADRLRVQVSNAMCELDVAIVLREASS